MRYLKRSLCLAIIHVTFCGLTYAENGVLVVHVASPNGQPIAGVVFSITGGGAISALTDESGKTEIKLKPQIRPGSEVILQLVKAPENLILLLPWDNRVKVSASGKYSQNYVQVVLTRKGDRHLLESTQALSALASRINTVSASKSVYDALLEDQRVIALNETSKTFGLKPEEVDRAIRQWGAKTTDPYEKGLVALYSRNYTEATRQLSKSLEDRKKKLKEDQDELANAYHSLGSSLYKQGRYREAANILQEAIEISPNDSFILDDLGRALHSNREYSKAEFYYRRALIISEKLWRPERTSVATILNNLALLYVDQRRYAEAEPLYRRALEILREEVGADHLGIGTTLENYASLLRKMNRAVEASQIEERAKAN